MNEEKTSTQLEKEYFALVKLIATTESRLHQLRKEALVKKTALTERYKFENLSR